MGTLNDLCSSYISEEAVSRDRTSCTCGLFVYLFVFLCLFGLCESKCPPPIGLDRITTAGMLPFGQPSIHLWSSLWIRHLWLGIRSVSGSLRRHLMHLVLSLSGIYWAVSHTSRNLSCQSALHQAPSR